MEIVPITQENSSIFEIFVQNYEAEFSAITQKEPSTQGLFSLDVDWKSPNCGFYLFKEGSQPGLPLKCR